MSPKAGFDPGQFLEYTEGLSAGPRVTGVVQITQRLLMMKTSRSLDLKMVISFHQLMKIEIMNLSVSGR